MLTVCQYIAFCTYSNGENGVLKLVPPQSNEVVILKKLLTIEDSHNPILPGIRIAELASAPSYSLVQMPEGKEIVYRDHAANLLDLAIQLVTGVMFLHDHNIAHLDIKRDNLLLSSTGKLSIIDFSVSQFAENSTTFTGFTGTKGCVAPEVDQGRPFSPFSADKWACGKILKDMACACSGLRFLPGILLQAMCLTDSDPSKRPPLLLIIQNLRKVQETVYYAESKIPGKRKPYLHRDSVA